MIKDDLPVGNNKECNKKDEIIQWIIQRKKNIIEKIVFRKIIDDNLHLTNAKEGNEKNNKYINFINGWI